jgi:hypothetical protein
MEQEIGRLVRFVAKQKSHRLGKAPALSLLRGHDGPVGG